MNNKIHLKLTYEDQIQHHLLMELILPKQIYHIFP